MIRSGKLVSVCPVPSVKAPVTEIKSVAYCSLHHLKCACNRNSMVPKRSLGLRACVACAACAVFAACAACVACAVCAACVACAAGVVFVAGVVGVACVL